MELLELTKRFAELGGSLIGNPLEVAMFNISHVAHFALDYIYLVDTYTKVVVEFITFFWMDMK